MKHVFVRTSQVYNWYHCPNAVIFFFFISKKKILLIKAREIQKVHGSEQWKKEATRQKQPLIYSNRRNKIRKGRTIRETLTMRPIKEGLLTKI